MAAVLTTLTRRSMELSWPLLRKALFCLDAETAHHATVTALSAAARCGLPHLLPPTPATSPVTLCGLTFPNKLGLAAGLDKTGACIDGFGSLGFGSVEIGTLTPRPQPGNPQPRLFRLPEHHAIINRMGFNNPGATVGNASARARHWQGILGVNIGKNFDTPNENAVQDYLLGLRAAWDHAHYITVNLSSPNTKGLRDLQQEETCRTLIRALHQEQRLLTQQHQRHVPILIKIAPDLDPTHIESLARLFVSEKLEGVIATNTTLSRTAITGHPLAAETGGLSGAPLTQPSTEIIALLCRHLDGALPIIGVGGIMTGAHALEKLQAGAALVQIYSGLIYRGPRLVREILEACATAAKP